MVDDTSIERPDPTGEMPGVRDRQPEVDRNRHDLPIPSDLVGDLIEQIDDDEDPVAPEGPEHENRPDALNIDDVIKERHRMKSPDAGLEPDVIAYRAEVERKLEAVKEEIERLVSLIGAIDANSLWRRPFSHWKRKELVKQYDAAIVEEHRLMGQLDIIELGKSVGLDGMI